MALTKSKLLKYREKLLKAKEEILKSIAVEQDYFIYNDKGDLVDQAEGAIQSEILNRLSDLDAEKIRLIDNALEKIEKGNYGICEGTGAKIPEARLDAIPWTPYTVEYAKEIEKKRV